MKVRAQPQVARENDPDKTMTLAYLATPYSKTGDLDKAYRDACALAARLILAGVNVFAPIVHAHGIAQHGKIDPLDQQFWKEADHEFLVKCDTLIVAHLDGWEQSSGIAHEIEFFNGRRKPIFDLDPVSLLMVRRERAA